MVTVLDFCRWKDDTADNDGDGRAFRAFSLFSNKAMTSLIGLLKISAAPDTSRRMSGSYRPLSSTSFITWSVKLTSFPQLHLVLNAHVSALPRTLAVKVRNDSSRLCRSCNNSERISQVAIGMTAREHMQLSNCVKEPEAAVGLFFKMLPPNSEPAH